LGDKPESRVAAPLHAAGAVELVALEELAPDETFRVRPDGDVSVLATSLGRLGQIVPVELRPWPGAEADGPRWQVVAGFRRLAAVRLLARERVLARLHVAMSDEDAWGLALAEALLQQPLDGAELEALRERLRATREAPWAEELGDEALVRAPVDQGLRERFYDFLTQAAPEPGAAASTLAPAPTEGLAPAPTPTPTPTSTDTPAGTLEPGHETIELTCDELARDVAARFSQLDQDLALLYENWADVASEERRALVEQARYVAALLPYMEEGG
jgi:ParB family transcriptional regulator, chromosome partitioning protein